jgi:hypothetical protein
MLLHSEIWQGKPPKPGQPRPEPEQPTPQPPQPEIPPSGPEEPLFPPRDPEPLPIPVPGPTPGLPQPVTLRPFEWKHIESYLTPKNI